MKMEFEINTAELLNIDDAEIADLLTKVYVAGGFVEPGEAALLFEPSDVRQRGLLIGAREKKRSTLAGIVIVVPPESPARRIAKGNESEMHLLGVSPEYRRNGLGRMLIDVAVESAKSKGYSKMILWTQASMKSAQKLYQAAGFIHMDNVERNRRKFRVYEMLFTVLLAVHL